MLGGALFSVPATQLGVRAHGCLVCGDEWGAVCLLHVLLSAPHVCP